MPWRNLPDWVMVQLTLSESEIVERLYVFLPLAADTRGQAFCDKTPSRKTLLWPEEDEMRRPGAWHTPGLGYSD